MSTKYDAILGSLRQQDTDSRNKGYFATQAALVAAYPTGQAGWYAVVGATDTIWIWDTDTSAWKNSGTGSMQQIQSDWNQTDTTAKDYIKNKPTVASDFIITATPTSSGSLTGTFDKTAAEMRAALAAGKNLLVKLTVSGTVYLYKHFYTTDDTDTLVLGFSRCISGTSTPSDDVMEWYSNDASYNLNSRHSEEPFRYYIMPTASSDYTGVLVQFCGSTTSEYKQGHYYQITGEEGSYAWQEVPVTVDLPSNEGTTGQVLKKTASGTEWADDLKAEIVLGPCTALGLGTSSSGPVFSWSDPDNVVLNGAVLGEWNRTVLVRKTGTVYPTSYSDGTVVAETSKSAGNKNYYHEHNFTDTTQETGVSYKYMLFSQTVAGAWNCLDGNKYTDGQGLSWSQVQGFVRAGRGAELFPVGTVFYVDHPEYTHTDGTGLWFRVAGHDQVPAQDQSLTHTMCLEMVDCLFSAPYDYNEAAYALTEDTVAIAGKVYYTLSGSTYTALVEGTDWNAGDPVPAASWYEANLSGRDYGSNNPVQNNQIQWLNSSGATGNWFTKQTIWDTCSTTLLNKNGFCMNLDPLFLAVVKPAKLITARCTAEGGGSVTHYAKFWSLSLTQIYGTQNSGITENVQLSYYSNSGEKRKKLKDSSDYAMWWLRSPYTGNSSIMYSVQVSGASDAHYASDIYGVSPACIIA